MFKKKLCILLCLILSLSACTNNANSTKQSSDSKQKVESSESKDQKKEATNETKAEDPKKDESKKEDVKGEEAKVNLPQENIMAVAWYQTSAEAKSLYQQGYNLAKAKLDEKIENNSSDKPIAIALDLDETVLDNSPSQAYLVVHNESYPKAWHEWIEYAKAEPVYGAKEFLDYADSKGVEIFYISDRSHDKDFDATKRNLEYAKIPLQGDDHLMLKKEGVKDKIARRNAVEEKYNLAMLFGDNLLDFDNPAEKTLESREAFVKEHAADFGDKYIVFPNPMYGSWEGTLYNNDFKKPAEEKHDLRFAALKIYNPETNSLETYQPSK